MCKKGEILRKGYQRRGYTRTDGTPVKATYVKAMCIKDRGNKGVSPRSIPPLKKGELTKYGYSLDIRLAGERRKILQKALKEYKPISVMRKLNAVATLLKNTSPTKSDRAKADSKWISRTYLSS